MRRIKKFKKSNQLIALLLAAVLSLSMGATAFAAETTPNTEVTQAESTTEPQTPIEIGAAAARSASGYAAKYTDYYIDSFSILVKGSASAVGTATIQAWDFPSGTEVTVSLERPNGSYAFTNVTVANGKTLSKTFTNFQIGTYTLHYTVRGTGQGWLNCNLS